MAIEFIVILTNNGSKKSTKCHLLPVSVPPLLPHPDCLISSLLPPAAVSLTASLSLHPCIPPPSLCPVVPHALPEEPRFHVLWKCLKLFTIVVDGSKNKIAKICPGVGFSLRAEEWEQDSVSGTHARAHSPPFPLTHTPVFLCLHASLLILFPW